jgi:glycosyltransferase involved in cell wall biosynthesis
MSQVYVSVIVPAKNAKETVVACAESLLNQRFLRKYEVICVDNGSEDSTVKVLRSSVEGVRILHARKEGSYYARNVGVQCARGNVLAFTDADCVADSDWLRYLTLPFRNNSVKLVGGDIRAFATDGCLQRYYGLFGHANDRSFGCFTPYFAASNLAVRKHDLQRTGLFNGTLRSGGDVEMCARLVPNRTQMVYEPRAVVNHIYSTSLVEFARKHYYYGSGYKLLKKKFKLCPEICYPSYASMLKLYGADFVLLRMLQDCSFKLGAFLA